MSTLGDNASSLSKLSLKMASGRSYQLASEDPASAIKAMKVRRSLSKIDNYQEQYKRDLTRLQRRESRRFLR
jgi:flagellin-like hook-associated protein FlgL